MTVIREEDVVIFEADALEHLSYFHPMDYIRAYICQNVVGMSAMHSG